MAQLDLGAGAGGVQPECTLSHSTLPSAQEEISLQLLFHSKLSKRYRMDAIMMFISLCLSPLVPQKSLEGTGWSGMGFAAAELWWFFPWGFKKFRSTREKCQASRKDLFLGSCSRFPLENRCCARNAP